MSRIAVFDIGTVTCRLGIFDIEEHHILNTVEKDLEICNLGMGVDSSNMLDESSITRVLECMKRFTALASDCGVDACICTLTSAARDADNASDLLEGLSALGISPQVISGDLEARLSFLGVAQDFVNETIAVMDSGGGSTELCIGTLKSDNVLEIEWVHSYNVGARRLTDRFFHANLCSPNKQRLEALKQAIAIYKQHVPSMDVSRVKLVGVGGTATTLSAIDQHMDVYDPSLIHLSKIPISQIEDMGEWLCGMSSRERESVSGLQPKRAEVIVGGICAVEGLMQVFDFEELWVSESDILCGLAIIADSSLKYEENVVEWYPQLFNL